MLGGQGLGRGSPGPDGAWFGLGRHGLDLEVLPGLGSYGMSRELWPGPAGHDLGQEDMD